MSADHERAITDVGRSPADRPGDSAREFEALVRDIRRRGGPGVDPVAAERAAAIVLLAGRLGLRGDELAALLERPERTARDIARGLRQSAPGREASA